MPDTAAKPALDPLSRSSEAIFGLLMALSFTGADHHHLWTAHRLDQTCHRRGDHLQHRPGADRRDDVLSVHRSSTVATASTSANQILAAEPDAAVELVRAEVGDWVNVSLGDNQLRQVVDLMRRNRATPDRAALLRSDLKGAASGLHHRRSCHLPADPAAVVRA